MLSYTYVPHELAEENQAIKIIKGKHKNIIFTFGHVSFDEEDGVPHLKFDYDVLEGTDPSNEEFNNILGDIVVDILEREFKEKSDGVFVNDTNDRENNTTQSAEEWGVYQKSYSFLKRGIFYGQNWKNYIQFYSLIHY